MQRVKIILSVLLATTLLVGCGVGGFIQQTYAKENMFVDGNGYKNTIYRAHGKNVSEVASDIEKNTKPEDMSKKDDEKMFLVYSDQLISISKDPNDSNHSLIEVMEKGFVEDNFDIGLLEAYLIASIVEDVMDIGLKSKKYKSRDYYGGYVTPGGKYYKTAKSGGSIRTGSVGNKSVRGGGPSSGK